MDFIFIELFRFVIRGFSDASILQKISIIVLGLCYGSYWLFKKVYYDLGGKLGNKIDELGIKIDNSDRGLLKAQRDIEENQKKNEIEFRQINENITDLKTKQTFLENRQYDIISKSANKKTLDN